MARTEDQTRPAPPASAPQAADSNGRGDAHGSRSRPTYAVRRLILPMLLLVVVLVVALGLMYFQQQTGFVSTDNALVAGNLVQVGPVSPVQVRSVTVDVGDRVDRNQVVATVIGPAGQALALRSTLEGVVLARYGNPGDIVLAGRPIVSVLDPTDLWIQAQVDEAQVGRVRPGQTAEVAVEALGRTLRGRVLSVGGASAAALSTSGQPVSPLRARQVVPVKIAVDPEGSPLVYGGQAFVRIHVQ